MPRLNHTPPRQDCPTDSSPAARGSGGRFRRLAAALFVFAMLGTALPAAAQTVITLISNSGQTSGFSVTGSIQSQPFTTGDHPGGYTVTSVEIKIEDLRANARDVKIVPNANNGEPDLSDVNTVISLSSPSSYSANSLNTFTAPANTTLTANTTYHVLVDEAGIVAHKIEQTSSSAEDSGGASGWSIGNTRYWKNTPAESWTTDTTKIVKMKVNGYTISTSNNAPTVANAIPDQRATVGTAFSYEFPAGTFNDVDSDALTYTATKPDGAALPTWLDFAPTTRTFSGMPQAADVATVAVKVTASDGNGGSISDEFDIVVSAAGSNNAPTVANPIPNQRATAGTAFSYAFLAGTFNDVDSDALTYTATKADGNERCPTWLVFTDSTRTFAGTPAGCRM